MNPRLVAFISVLVASFLPTPFLRAQTTDMEGDDAIQEATESAKKMGVKMPDVKKQLEEVDKEEAKEKAALQKQLEAPGPVTLPDWTPKVPEFKPAGPVSKKIVGDEVDIIQTGTSLLTPAALGDSWETAKGDKLNSSRTNGSYNDTKVVTIYLSTRQEPLQSVVLEARRAPEEKLRTSPFLLHCLSPWLRKNRAVSPVLGSARVSRALPIRSSSDLCPLTSAPT